MVKTEFLKDGTEILLRVLTRDDLGKLRQFFCSLPDDDRYPAIGRVKSAVDTERLLSTEQAAARIIHVLPKLLEYPSGSYVDIREM